MNHANMTILKILKNSVIGFSGKERTKQCGTQKRLLNLMCHYETAVLETYNSTNGSDEQIHSSAQWIHNTACDAATDEFVTTSCYDVL